MSEHVSALMLDSLSAGLAVDAAAKAHVDSCPACLSAVTARRTMASAMLERPEARRRLGILQSQVVVQPARPKMAWWAKLLLVSVPVALAVGIVAMRVGAEPVGDRVKGGGALSVLVAGAPVQSATVGSKVTLALGSSGGYAAVLAVDAHGDVDIVWPPKGDTSQRVAGGASETLAEFEVTPGSMTLHAIVSDEPLQLDRLVRATRAGDMATLGGSVLTTHLEVTP